MADSNLNIARIVSTPSPAAPVAIAKTTVTEKGVTDEVVLTPVQLRAEAAALKNESLAETATAVTNDRQGDTKKAEAVEDSRQASVAEFEAKKTDKAADQAAGEAAAAQAEEAENAGKAQEARWKAEAKQAEADLERQKADLLQAQGNELLASDDLEKFNEGVYLLGLADSGFETAHSLRDEALHLASNVQASLDLAKSAHERAVSKGDESKKLRDEGHKGHEHAQEETELSGRALEASNALKLDASERRKVAEKLMAEAAVDNELADLGQKVQNGFLLH